MKLGATLLLMGISFCLGGLIVLLICMSQRTSPPTFLMWIWLVPAAGFSLSGIGVLVASGLRIHGQ